jgi:hypothetical protein
MSTSSQPNIPNLIVMIRPASFGFNGQTAASNFFQQNMTIEDIGLKARLEFDAMVEKLALAHIHVKVFDDLSPGLPDSVFCNNWMAQLPEKRVIIFPMLTENRRAEIRSDIIEWIKLQTESTELIDLRKHTATNQFLEGTGSVVFDYRNKIAYACESPRTDIALFEQFVRQIGYTPVSFLALDLNANPVYHTNVVMTVANQYALVCFDAIEDAIERSMLHINLEGTGHDIVPLSFSQLNSFAGNCIEIQNSRGESYLLMSSAAENALTDLQKFTISKYSKILSFEIPVIEQIGGGSVRCMITGLFKP